MDESEDPLHEFDIAGVDWTTPESFEHMKESSKEGKDDSTGSGASSVPCAQPCKRVRR